MCFSKITVTIAGMHCLVMRGGTSSLDLTQVSPCSLRLLKGANDEIVLQHMLWATLTDYHLLDRTSPSSSTHVWQKQATCVHLGISNIRDVDNERETNHHHHNSDDFHSYKILFSD